MTSCHREKLKLMWQTPESSQSGVHCNRCNSIGTPNCFHICLLTCNPAGDTSPESSVAFPVCWEEIGKRSWQQLQEIKNISGLKRPCPSLSLCCLYVKYRSLWKMINFNTLVLQVSFYSCLMRSCALSYFKLPVLFTGVNSDDLAASTSSDGSHRRNIFRIFMWFRAW